MQVIPIMKPTGPGLAPRGGGGLTSGDPGGGGAASRGNGELSQQRGFPFGETEIAAATGIALKLLAKTRRQKLRQGEDWDLNGLRVAYSKTGLAAVLEKITGRVEATEALETLTRIDHGTAPAAPGVLGTVKKFYLNPRLLGVQVNGTLVNVRVKETKNFQMGMDVPLRRIDGRYELGRRCPRFPGRW